MLIGRIYKIIRLTVLLVVRINVHFVCIIWIAGLYLPHEMFNLKPFYLPSYLKCFQWILYFILLGSHGMKNGLN